MSTTRDAYHPIPAADLPENLRWDVPARNGGQIVEVAYAHRRPAAAPAAPAVRGAAYKRVTDTSIPVGADGRVTYYRRGRA